LIKKEEELLGLKSKVC